MVTDLVEVVQQSQGRPDAPPLLYFDQSSQLDLLSRVLSAGTPEAAAGLPLEVSAAYRASDMCSHTA